MPVELRHLRYFVAVADELNFTRAAKRLNVSTSGVSQAIRKLEEQIGVRLLTRTTRSVSLTAAGERLMEAIGHRFDEIEAELDALMDQCRSNEGCDQQAFNRQTTRYYQAHGMRLSYAAGEPPRLHVDVAKVVQRNRDRVRPLAIALRRLAAERGRLGCPDGVSRPAWLPGDRPCRAEHADQLRQPHRADRHRLSRGRGLV